MRVVSDGGQGGPGGVGVESVSGDEPSFMDHAVTYEGRDVTDSEGVDSEMDVNVSQLATQRKRSRSNQGNGQFQSSLSVVQEELEA